MTYLIFKLWGLMGFMGRLLALACSRFLRGLSPLGGLICRLYLRNVLYLRIPILLLGFAVVVLFVGCAELFISPTCGDGVKADCPEDLYNKKPLSKKSVQILIVMDNSPLGQKLNPHLVSNFTQMEQCLKPIDWSIAMISSVEDKNAPVAMGQPINMEITHSGRPHSSTSLGGHKKEDDILAGQDLLTEQAGSVRQTGATGPTETTGAMELGGPVLTSDMPNHAQILNDTLSLNSGCSNPPFCYKGKHKPFSAVRAFMENTQGGKQVFLEPADSFVVIVVSTADERGFGSKTSHQEALDSIMAHHRPEKFMTLAVTDAKKPDDCINTFGDFIKKGVGFIAKVGDVVGMVTRDPIMMLSSAGLSAYAQGGRSDNALIPFAKQTGGTALDICKSFFGRSLAYSILKNVERDKQFPKQCKQLEEPNGDGAEKKVSKKGL